MPPIGSINSVVPAVGRPHGGQVIRIAGTGFRTPLRVFFDLGEPLPIEAVVVSATSTQIEAITPPVNLGGGQERRATVVVISEAGTTSERRFELRDGFTFRNEVLQPSITTLTPTSGSVRGDTRLTIFGEGFQAPVKVTFFTGFPAVETEVRVLDVRFNEITIVTPSAEYARVVANQSVHVRVLNIYSGTDAVLRDAFRYLPAMQIVDVSPAIGPAGGGTDLHINGVGFMAPVAVYVGDVAAMPIQVSGTRIVARTMPSGAGCIDVSAPVRVIDIANGDIAIGPSFTYVVSRPVILRVAPVIAQVGQVVEIELAGANGPSTLITAGGASFSSPIEGRKAWFTVPPTLSFPRTACSYEGFDGTGPAPFVSDLSVTDAAGCTVSLPSAITFIPAENTPCTIPPAARVTAPSDKQCLRFGRSSPQTLRISIENVALPGRAWLHISGMSLTGPNAGDFELALVPGTSPWASPGQSVSFEVTLDRNADGYLTAQANFHTNDPNRPVIPVCIRAFRF